MAELLSFMIPAAETALKLDLRWFRIYRDDGLTVIFAPPEVVPLLQEFFNNFSRDIQWTLPQCSTCSQPLVTCPHYTSLDFLDSRIFWSKDQDGHWQFKMTESSKPTDVHAYLAPSSCSAPHLTSEGVSVAKTVGVRLRALHTNDSDLLNSLNRYCGYLLARGYQETSVKFHLSAMANRDRGGVLRGLYKQGARLTVPLVTDLHPAITMASSTLGDTLGAAVRRDSLLNALLPNNSLLVAYRRLPNLSRLLCGPDQNKFLNMPPRSSPTGHINTGCRCQVCKASTFGPFVSPPSLPGYKLQVCGPVTCSSGPALVYHLTCKSGRPQCSRAHYTGSASSSNQDAKPMCLRWSNHKSHHRKGKNLCQMTDHLLTWHQGEDPQQFVKITILEACPDLHTARERETVWSHRLFSFYPSGLNKREEIQIDPRQ